jgi:hypothetical protein
LTTPKKEVRLNIDSLSSRQEVRIRDLMTDSFVSQHSNFRGLQTLIDASGITHPEDIDNELFSQFIGSHTSFGSWADMLRAAGVEYSRHKMGY